MKPSTVSKLAAKYGTPLYVYSASAIQQRFRALEQSFRHVPHTICYSVKANANLWILKVLAGLGSGFDVVSGGELQRVLRAAPRRTSQVVFSGVGKTADEIDLALRAGILLFNVESEAELAGLAARAARLKKKARIALRVNPEVAANTHPYIATGLREHKFGVPWAEAGRLYRYAAGEKWLAASGVSAHIGSQIMDVAPFGELAARLAELIRELRAQGIRIRYLDLGGGLGIPYEAEESPANFARRIGAYTRAVSTLLCKLDVHLLLEPGRILVGPAGMLLTRVTYLKQHGPRRFAIIDAGMNDLLRPALYGARHRIIAIPEGATSQSDAEVMYDVAGPVCETADVFAHDIPLPELQEGTLLAILDAGAYGMSLASNYNSRPRAAEALVSGNRAKLIRRRETFEDLVRSEVLRR